MVVLPRPHTSRLDGLAVALWLTRERGVKNALFAVDPDYARHPIWRHVLSIYGWIIGRHEMLPLDSQRPYGLRHLIQAAQDGRTVVIFPQGTGIANPMRVDQPGFAWMMRKVGQGNAVDVIDVQINHDSRWPACRMELAANSVQMGKDVKAHAYRR